MKSWEGRSRRLSSMKIGIDARFLNESGIGRYLNNLISNLKIIDKKNQYFVFLLSKDFQDFKETENFKKVEAPFSWYGFAEQFKFPKLLKKYNLDLVHFPHFNVPIFYRGKFIVTIHDLIHQHHSMKRTTTLDPFVFKIKQIGYRKVFKQAITESERILVPSKFVSKLLVEEWKVEDKKITVTPEAVDDIFSETSKNLKLPNKITSPYILYVGNAYPHKNVESLEVCFWLLFHNFPDLKLVLVGKENHFWEKFMLEVEEGKKKLEAEKNIIFTGFVSDEQLANLYKNASVYVEPSFEEGFGLPILEAMSLGCPVVSSNAGSLPEIGGEAAIYFDPMDIEEMCKKIGQVLESAELRKELIEKGKKRVKQFSWKKMTQQTLEVYAGSNRS